jgi:hypothetical protein
MGIRKIGLAAHGRAKSSKRCRSLAGSEQAVAQVIVGQGVIRLEFRCPAKERSRFVAFPLAEQGDSKIELSLDRFGRLPGGLVQGSFCSHKVFLPNE